MGRGLFKADVVSLTGLEEDLMISSCTSLWLSLRICDYMCNVHDSIFGNVPSPIER